jgi:vancomycin permeability regulator SanA
MPKRLKQLVVFFLVFFTIHQIIIISDGLIDDEKPDAEVAVILGSKVNEDGSLSPRLKARLDKGLELYRDSAVNQLYVSGGLGKEGFFEGSVMAEYLEANGVPTGAIKIDNHGTNTRQSAINFKRDYPSENSVILVSQYFHITRCKLAFRQVGVTNAFGSHCNFFEKRDPYSAFREFFGYYKYLALY